MIFTSNTTNSTIPTNYITTKRLDDLLSKGDSLYKQGNYKGAIDAYNKALQINATNVYALYDKGLALSHLGRYQEAIQNYDKALQIDPTNTLVMQNKELAQQKLQQQQQQQQSSNNTAHSS